MIEKNILLYYIKEYMLNSLVNIRRGWKEENIIFLCGSCENPFRKYQIIENFRYDKFNCPRCNVVGFIEQRDISLSHENTLYERGVIPFIELGDSKEWEMYAKSEECNELSYMAYKNKIKESKRLSKMSNLERYKKEVLDDIELQIEVEKLREVLREDRIVENSWKKLVWKRVNGKR